MNSYEEKPNNELLFELKKLEAEYEAIKVKIINDYDKLTYLENEYVKINNILNNRLNNT